MYCYCISHTSLPTQALTHCHYYQILTAITTTIIFTFSTLVVAHSLPLSFSLFIKNTSTTQHNCQLFTTTYLQQSYHHHNNDLLLSQSLLLLSLPLTLSLLTTHYSLLTTHYSLLTTYYLLLTNH